VALILVNRRACAVPLTRRAGGIHALELLFLLPIILALILGMVEFSLVLAADQQLAVASREGSRVAAQGGGPAEVEAAARLVLGSGKLGNNTLVSSQLTDVSGSPVSVTVTVADAAAVVPNLLRFVGYSIKDKPLASVTIMRRE
jgi:Flp pilus assembly protein TadG